MRRSLRIFLCCQQDTTPLPHAVPAYRFWREYFLNGLAEDGHQILEAPACDWAQGLVPMEPELRIAWMERTWSQAIRWIRAENARQPIDLFLSYLFPEQIDASSLEEIGSLRIPRVNFFCDNVREFRAVPESFHIFDLHWVPELKALEMYRNAELPFLHAPMPCWIPREFRSTPDNESYPVSFVGTKDELRAALFAKAFALGLDARVWGRGWIDAPHERPIRPSTGSVFTNQVAFFRQHGLKGLYRKIAGKIFPTPGTEFDFGPFASVTANDAEYWKVLRESVVCLGVNRFPSPRNSADKPDTYSRLRDVEAPMAGACYLTEWTEGLDGLYELGTEIETFRDAEELVEKSNALRADQAHRRRLRKAAQRRALAHHTIARTITRISDRLGLG